MSCPLDDLEGWVLEHWGLDELCLEMGCEECGARPGDVPWLDDERDEDL